MDYLRQLWTYDSFRSSVAALIALSADSLSKVADLDELDDVSKETRESLGVSQISLDALAILRSLSRDEGVDAVLDELEMLVETDTRKALDLKRNALLDALRSSDSVIRSAHARAEASSIFPTLMQVRAEVDFRTTRDPLSDEPSVLPLVSIRLTFDETVGGSNAVFFQVPVPALESLLSNLQETLENVKEAVANVGQGRVS